MPPLEIGPPPAPQGLSPAEAAVYRAIRGRTHIDAICQQVELAPSQVLASLTLLQVKGLVRECGPKYFEIG